MSFGHKYYCAQHGIEHTHLCWICLEPGIPLGPIMPSETRDGLALVPSKPRPMAGIVDAMNKIEGKKSLAFEVEAHDRKAQLDKPLDAWQLYNAQPRSTTFRRRTNKPNRKATYTYFKGIIGKYWIHDGWIYKNVARNASRPYGGMTVHFVSDERGTRMYQRDRAGNIWPLPISKGEHGKDYWENKRYTAAPSFDKLQQGRNCS